MQQERSLQKCVQLGGMEQKFELKMLDQKNPESILEEIIDVSVIPQELVGVLGSPYPAQMIWNLQRK